MVTRESEDVVLVDLEFKNTKRENAYRAAKAVDPSWHREQADAYKKPGEAYACLFHHAWLLKNDPDNKELQQDMVFAYLMSKREGHPLFLKEYVLPDVVKDALKLTEGQWNDMEQPKKKLERR